VRIGPIVIDVIQESDGTKSRTASSFRTIGLERIGSSFRLLNRSNPHCICGLIPQQKHKTFLILTHQLARAIADRKTTVTVNCNSRSHSTSAFSLIYLESHRHPSVMPEMDMRMFRRRKSATEPSIENPPTA